MQKGAGDNRGTEARFGGRFRGQKQKNEKKLCFLPFKTLSVTVKDSFSVFLSIEWGTAGDVGDKCLKGDKSPAVHIGPPAAGLYDYALLRIAFSSSRIGIFKRQWPSLTRITRFQSFTLLTISCIRLDLTPTISCIRYSWDSQDLPALW